MKIKEPACYDVSHWKEVPDFRLVSPRPALFITKASEAYPAAGYNHTDVKFVRFFEGMMEIEVIRGAYHFFRKSLDSVKQAMHFVNVVSQVEILRTDILILDVEEGGEKAPQLWAWFNHVRSVFPDNPVMLYSRKNILDAISMTFAEREFFKGIPTWTAGYPIFPDLFLSVPKGYVPDQTKYGPACLWQYSAHGAVTGIQGDVDLNWIDPVFYTMLGSNKKGEETMANFEGKANETAKVWATIGGARVYPDVTANQSIKADAEQTVAGTRYIHLKSPIIGWSKAQWFSYHPVTTPPPDPDPEPDPPPAAKAVVKGVLHFDDGSTQDLFPQ
jgi:GH25 family lysozyme M1 (1,4-beta-N-acetylmuramidase)